MNRKLMAALILVPSFLASLAMPCSGEDSKTALTVNKVLFGRMRGDIEKVTLFCSQTCVPRLSSVEDGSPRVVMDVEGVSPVRPKSLNVNVGGKYVKKVRSYFDKEANVLRIVLDLDPAKYYLVSPKQDPSGNYMVAIKGETDAPWGEKTHITLLHPDLRQEVQGGQLAETPSRQENPGAIGVVKGQPSLDEGRSQLKAGKFAAAVDTFTDILAARPQDSLAYRLRGNAYDNLGDRQKAIADWSQAARLGDSMLPSFLDFLQVKWRQNQTL
jgi:hypothetical protein